MVVRPGVFLFKARGPVCVGRVVAYNEEDNTVSVAMGEDQVIG